MRRDRPNGATTTAIWWAEVSFSLATWCSGKTLAVQVAVDGKRSTTSASTLAMARSWRPVPLKGACWCVICGKAATILYGDLDGPTQNKRHIKKKGWVENTQPSCAVSAFLLFFAVSEPSVQPNKPKRCNLMIPDKAKEIEAYTFASFASCIPVAVAATIIKSVSSNLSS